ncbi:MAG TPA: GWxTD domain-containing protein [Balneolaceae bacterium]|nr:GWxTD domain-containing protein [Balneolaceae bacterium]
MAASKAQIKGYAKLAARHNRPSIYLSTFTLPGASKDSLRLILTFNISHKMLSFKKEDKPGSFRFYARPLLSIKVYESPRNNLGFKEKVSVIDLESVARKTWKDTVYAANYEATNNVNDFAAGFLQMKLPPGAYTYILQFGRRENEAGTSGTRNIKLDGTQKGEIVLIDSVNISQPVERLGLVNMGDNIPFRKGFYAFIRLPAYNQTKDYKLNVQQLNISDEDTTSVKKVFESTIADEDIISSVHPVLRSDGENLFLRLQSTDQGQTYALVKIPNHKFPDAAFRIEVTEQNKENIIAQKTVQSFWVDKPISLYDIDVAINALGYIADEETIKNIKSGSTGERKKKFDAFWKKRDPIPDTEYNELKIEYYRRIDYAFRHYSSRSHAGFETDRGRIYILYGPPDDIERVYPRQGATREIWTYPNRRFVFKATSGYGDFVLLE